MQITGLSEKKQKKTNKQTQYARIQVNAAAFVKILDEKKNYYSTIETHLFIIINNNNNINISKIHIHVT